MEIWKDVRGYENLYQVSNYGRVKSLGRKKGGGLTDRYIGNVSKEGYVTVVLSKNGKVKNWRVHRLVYETFVGEIPIGMVINHKDENPTNNCVINLEICTPKENANYGTRNFRLSHINGKVVECIETGERFRSASFAAKLLGLSQGHISSCCRGKRKTTGGFHFKYV